MEFIYSLEYNGSKYIKMTVDELLNASIPQDVIDEAIASKSLADSITELRSNIFKGAGDVLSLLSTASDGVSLTFLYMLAQEKSRKIAKEAVDGGVVDGFDVYNTSMDAILGALGMDVNDPNTDPAALATALLDKIANREVIYPVLVKGLTEFIAESSARGTSIALLVKAHREERAALA